MRVLVTGGTGFLGRHLVARCLARGDDVTVLSRDPSRATGPATRILAWDPLAAPPPARTLASIEAVVNLLGESIAKGRWTAAKKNRIRDSRIAGTRSLVAGIAAASPRPRVLVSGSAIGYYGPHGDEDLDESSSAGGDFLAGLSAEWEAEARQAEGLGLRVVLMRTGIVLGADGGALRAMLTPFRLGLGGRVASGQQWMSWIHVDDWCSLVLHAIGNSSVQGPVNGTAPSPVRNRDFVKALGDVLNRPTFLPTPAPALRLLLGEMADSLLISGQKVLPQRALQSGFRFRHADLEKALRNVLKRP